MGYSRKKLDLTGRRFGKLTVLEPAANAGTKTAWLCRCDCGKEAVVTTQRLRDGHRTSCGCDKELFGEPPSAIGRASLTYIDGTCVEMIRTRPVRSNNTSGVTGVDWLASKGRWRATICFKGKRRYLGSYEKLEDAVKARSSSPSWTPARGSCRQAGCVLSRRLAPLLPEITAISGWSWPESGSVC